MKLKVYLKKRGITNSEFARDVHVTPQCVDHWVEGRRQPRSKMLHIIKQLTNGLVTPNDFLPDTQPQSPN